MTSSLTPRAQPTVPAPAPSGTEQSAKPLRLVDLILFSVTAIVVADTVGAASAIGVRSLTF